jgi:hypothetical protein
MRVCDKNRNLLLFDGSKNGREPDIELYIICANDSYHSLQKAVA